MQLATVTCTAAANHYLTRKTLNAAPSVPYVHAAAGCPQCQKKCDGERHWHPARSRLSCLGWWDVRHRIRAHERV